MAGIFLQIPKGKRLESRKHQAIQNLIEIFAEEWPRKNHIIVIDMSTGTFRVDQMLALEAPVSEAASDAPVAKADPRVVSVVTETPNFNLKSWV